ncbi:MAG: hypothetical protein HZA13_00200 [Nitrospirae bacterium]|nr:hypothetical protein [Nitrospirota bacterium]
MRALRGRLHPALQVEGGGRSPAEGSSQRAKRALRGRLQRLCLWRGRRKPL